MTTIVRRPAKASRRPPEPAALMQAASPPPSKIQTLVALLSRKEGASIDELAAATSWQKHSVRGAISGAIKKKLGLSVSSKKTDAGRIYRIVEAVQ